MMSQELDYLSGLLREVAREELLPRFADVAVKRKADGSLVTEADLMVQNRLVEELARRYPEVPLLGEEMTAVEQQRLLASPPARGFWCLDPLDGTSNFASGIPFFSVSLALVRNGETVLGVIHDPVRDETFAAERGRGACLDGASLMPGTAKPLRRSMALIDFKRLSTALATRLAAQPPYPSQRSFGSVALDWCWLAAGRCHIYLHGGQKLWDYAAGSLILDEAGGRASTLAGAPVRPDTLKPQAVVAASHPDTFAEWRAWLDAG